MSDTADSLSHSAEERFQSLVEDYLGRCRRGESPDLSSYVDSNPDLADRIRDCFPALVLMEKVAAARPASEEPERTTLGEYRIVREIGRGGMGVVYEAEQPSLQRHVALKVLPFHRMMDERILQRFQREAAAAGRLQHPNIVPVHGWGEQEGVYYYAMERIEGQALSDLLPELGRLRSSTGDGCDAECAGSDSEGDASTSTSRIAADLFSGRFSGPDHAHAQGIDPSASAERVPPRELLRSPRARGPLAGGVTPPGFHRSVARLGLQVAEALAYAHDRGVLHRDIKPANLIVDARGWTWITDFGLAKVADTEDLTLTGEILGTLRYMPPESFEGEYGPQGDIYSVGLTLYELLLQRPAFDGARRQELLRNILETTPQRPSVLDPSIPRPLEAIVLKASAADPGCRYERAADLAADLRCFLEERPVRATIPSLPRRRRVRRLPVALGLAVAAVLAVTSVVSILSRPTGPQVIDIEIGGFPQDVAVVTRAGGKLTGIFCTDHTAGDVTVLSCDTEGSIVVERRIPVGEQPLAVVLSDVDGDGLGDLITTSKGDRTLTVHLRAPEDGGGAGTWFPETSNVVPLSSVAWSVCAGDFDGDGDNDLATIDGKDSVWILANQGNAQLSETTRLDTVSIGNWVAAGDLNGEGRLDLVCTAANATGRTVSVLRNRGDGTFEDAVYLGGAPPAYGVHLVDLDGDGDLDLVGAARGPNGEVLRDLWLARNSGDGAFAPVETWTVAATVDRVAAADLDRDGDIDLAIAGGQNDFLVLRNEGEARFTTAMREQVGDFPGAIDATDVDGDGHVDVVLANTSGSITVLLNRNGGLCPP